MSRNALKRVLWRDGEVLTEGHFYALEEWGEQLVGLVNQQLGTHGLIRHPALQVNYNQPSNIKSTQVEGTHFRVEIREFQAINKHGRFIQVDAPHVFDFHFKQTQRTPDGKYYLYIRPEPGAKGREPSSDAGVSTGVVLYDAMYELSGINDEGSGVALCRFRIDDGQMDIDASYIPFGVHMDSTPASAAWHQGFCQKLNQWTTLLTRYLGALTPTPDMMVVWTATGQLLRSAAMLRPVLESQHAQTLHFLRTVQQLVNAISTEITILSAGWQQDSLRKRGAEVTAMMEQPVAVIIDQQVELAATFVNCDRLMDACIKFLSYMPAGPVTEKTLAIARADFVKEPAGNKITLALGEEASFLRGKSRITIHLREFSKSDPVGGNVRVGLGVAIFAQLLDIRSNLKRVPGDAYDYVLECPGEVVTRDRASQITMYLPPPLGEGIQDIKSHVTIVSKD